MTENKSGSAWPKNQFHPVYTSLREWLDSEAPEDNDDELRRRRNGARKRWIRRR